MPQILQTQAMKKQLLMLIFFILSLSSFAQNKIIKGMVLDSASRQSIPGANIEVGKAGTSTDIHGEFTIAIPAMIKELKITCLGYKSQTIYLDTISQPLTILLSHLEAILTQVVVTGYTSQSKSRTTGAISQVSAAKLAAVPVGSFDVALQGTAPGIYVGTPTGQPGESGRVTIRGIGSINGDINPLYILDGVPISPADFAALNTADFESVTLLKDAAATAQYGARAANGVIVINTKTGLAPGDTSKLRITFDTQFGMSRLHTSKWDQMNTDQRLQFEQAIQDPTLPGWAYSANNPNKIINGISMPKTAADYAYGNHFLDSLRKINTNWLKLITRTAYTTSNQLSIAGKSDKTNYYISAYYLNQQGIILNSGLQRYGIRSNISTTAGKLKTSLNIGLSLANIDYIIGEGGGGGPGGINAGGGGFSQINPVAAMYYALPYESVSQGPGPGHIGNNALDELKNNYYRQHEVQGLISFNNSYRLSNNWQIRSTLGIDATGSKYNTYYSPDSFLGQQVLNGGSGLYQDSTLITVRMIANAGLRYRKEWGTNEIEANFLQEINSTKVYYDGFIGYGLQSGFSNPGAGITQGTSTNNYIPGVASLIPVNNVLASQIALLRYTYNDKYTLTGSLRRDGSSQVGPDNRYKYLYAIGGIWDIEKEKFMNDVSTIDILRLRGSYGLTANQGGFTTDFGYRTLYATSSYNGQKAYSVLQASNPSYNWELNRIADVGIEFSLFNHRLYGDVDLYNRVTDGLFVNQNLSLTTGFQTIATNGGKARNRGVELGLNYDIIRRKDLKITIGANFAYNQNTILSLGGENQLFLDPYTVCTPGQPLGEFYLVRWAGVNPENGAPVYLDKNGNKTETYNAADAVLTGKTYDPPIKGGFITDFTYKRFTASILWSYIKGMTRLDLTNFYVNSADPNNRYNNQSAVMLNVWQNPGNNTNIPGAQYTSYPTTKDLHSSDYLKLRNLSISYNVPQSALKKRFHAVRFFVQGVNLIAFTRWKGLDQEDANDIAQYEYPAPATITMGANFTL